MILFLNDIGTGELLLVLAFILIFFGSKSIPGLARTFGQTIRKVKDASNDLQSEIRKSGMDIKSELDISGIVRETADEIRQPLDQYASDIEDVVSRRPIHSHAKVPVAPLKIESEESTKTEKMDELAAKSTKPSKKTPSTSKIKAKVKTKTKTKKSSSTAKKKAQVKSPKK